MIHDCSNKLCLLINNIELYINTCVLDFIFIKIKKIKVKKINFKKFKLNLPISSMHCYKKLIVDIKLALFKIYMFAVRSCKSMLCKSDHFTH